MNDLLIAVKVRIVDDGHSPNHLAPPRIFFPLGPRLPSQELRFNTFLARADVFLPMEALNTNGQQRSSKSRAYEMLIISDNKQPQLSPRGSDKPRN